MRLNRSRHFHGNCDPRTLSAFSRAPHLSSHQGSGHPRRFGHRNYTRQLLFDCFLDPGSQIPGTAPFLPSHPPKSKCPCLELLLTIDERGAVAAFVYPAVLSVSHTIFRVARFATQRTDGCVPRLFRVHSPPFGGMKYKPGTNAPPYRNRCIGPIRGQSKKCTHKRIASFWPYGISTEGFGRTLSLRFYNVFPTIFTLGERSCLTARRLPFLFARCATRLRRSTPQRPMMRDGQSTKNATSAISHNRRVRQKLPDFRAPA